MRVPSIAWFGLLALLVLPLFSTGTLAARITAPALHSKAVAADDKVSAYWPTDPVQCDLILEGDIVDGDAALLEREFATIVGSWNSFSFFLCLRSGGGSVPEALRMAKFVRNTQRPSIATVVEDGESCASACALIFLAGNAPARKGAWPQRFLHPRGRLLYHSSRLDLSRFTDDALLAHLTAPTGDNRGLKGKIADLYKDGLRDVQSVISTFQGFSHYNGIVEEPWVRQSLFVEMFAQDPNEWICMDSVDAIGRWRIQAFGYGPPVPPSKNQNLNVCHNAFNWHADEFAAGALNENSDAELEVKTPPPTTKIAGRNKQNRNFDTRVTLKYQAVYAQHTCVIEASRQNEKKQLDAESRLAVLFLDDSQDLAIEIPNLTPVSFFDARTLLAELPTLKPARKVTAGKGPERSFRRFPNSLMNGCSYKSLAKVGIDACQAACSTDSACLAYSYNKGTRACELKHTLTAMRLDPLWTSGAPTTGPAPERSSRAVSMVEYIDRNNPALDGDVIEADKAPDNESCVRRCESDRNCLATEYVSVGELCRRYSSISGFKPAPGPELIDIRLKRQK